MTGLGAGDAGPTGDLQVQVDEPESESVPSQVGDPHHLPFLFCREQITVKSQRYNHEVTLG